MAPEDNKFDDEDYFLKKKEDKYFFKNDDDYFNSESNTGRYSRYEKNKDKYYQNHDEEDKEIHIRREREDKEKYSFYEREENGFDEEKDTKDNEPEVKKYKDRFADDFFKDEDFDYSDDEVVPTGEDPEEYSLRTKRIKQRRKRRKIITSSILIIILIAAIATGVFFGYKFIKNKLMNNSNQTQTTTAQPISIPSNLQLTEDISMAVAGAAENLQEPDINFIFFSRFDSKNSKLSTVTIPVKTLMDIPGFGLESVDKAVGYGGMDLLMLTLKKALGMDLNKYIIFDIKDIVDKLGGITINLDQAATIKNFKDGSPIELQQGENKLDGIKAISYLIYFNGSQKDVAINLTSNQKKIFDSLFLQIAGKDDKELEKNLNSIKSFYETNLTDTEIYQLISTVSKLKPENNAVYPLDVTSVELEGGNVFYVPDISKLGQFFNVETNNTTESTVLNKVTVDLQVLNGVGTPGIAGKVGTLFKDLKYDDGTPKFNLLQAKDADNYNYATTQIIVNSKDPSYMALAEEIKNILKTGNITKNEQAPAQNIVIIVGADYGKTSDTTQTTQQVGAPAKINILNGVGIAGLAKKAKKQLEDSMNADTKVIEVVETKNAANFNYKQTEILFFQNTDEVNNIAQKIQKILGVGVIKYSEKNPDNVAISIILGKDYSTK
ncbi:MAG: LCP family protein [Cyanobacteria bacterium]|nr:LCP family protein [Cyanobacteriota bacterium]